MRIIMPLFEFNYKGTGFKFTDIYSVERFDAVKDLPAGLPGLSELDVSHVSLEHWAMVANDPPDGYRSDINLLLIAFRVYLKARVFTKWHFCKEDARHSYRIASYERFRNPALNSSRSVDDDGLVTVRDGFLHLIEMYKVSDRSKNALYFVWRGLCSRKHIDAYIFLVCAIEALFSGETSDDVTSTVIKRTQNFLTGVKGFGGDQVKKIYKTRSDMVHGRIPYTEKNSEQVRQNIQNLAKLESLVFASLNKMLDEQIYLQYKNTETKERFLNNLTTGNPITNACTGSAENCVPPSR